jgi:hypothetical protein
VTAFHLLISVHLVFLSVLRLVTFHDYQFRRSSGSGLRARPLHKAVAAADEALKWGCRGRAAEHFVRERISEPAAGSGCHACSDLGGYPTRVSRR